MPARRRLPDWITPRRLLMAAAVAVVVAAAAFLVPLHRFSPFYPCKDGLVSRAGLCIGVTDSSNFGDPDLSAVMDKIAAENANASAPGQNYYSLAYLGPFEPPDARTAVSTGLRREIEGVYLAQYRANRTNELGDTPKIKIFVANAGPRNEHWETVSKSLIELSQGPDRLRAVVGLGNSLETTKMAIRMLTQPPDGASPVATIGARLTADSLKLMPLSPDDRRVEGFFRVAPTNTDEAVAAVDHIQQMGYTRPLLLKDRNSADAYVTTLGAAFRNVFGNTAAEETFNGGQDGLANAFDGVVRNLCVTSPDVVYFAGRGDELVKFVEVLSARKCRDAPINIVTGDDISGLITRAQQGSNGVNVALSGNVTVAYTALASPTLWADIGSRSRYSAVALSYFERTCDQCWSTQFPEESLDDGAAIMGHDAAVLAVTAIRRAESGAGTADTSAVIQLLYQVRGANAVVGASGELSMTECGDVERKPFAVLSLGADGSSALVRTAVSTGRLPCGS